MNSKILPLLLLLCIITVASCKKKDEPVVTPVPTTNNTNNDNIPTADFYFQATINGTEIILEDAVNNYANGAGWGAGSVPSGYQERQSSQLMDPFQTSLVLGGIIIMKTFAQEPTDTEIENMVSVKSYTYGIESLSTGEDGVDGAKVFYQDANGVLWGSDFGTGSQSGSSFSITEHITNTDGWSKKISSASFSCTLYDQSGNSMPLTNGIFRGRTVQY